MKIDAYVDVQGFVGSDGDFVPKEVAIVFDETNFKTLIIEAPYPIQQLNQKQQKSVVWLSNNHHGIRWQQGDITLSILKGMMTEYTSGKTVCVRGNTKLLWISDNCEEIFRIHNTETSKSSLSFKQLKNMYPNIKRCNQHKGRWCALQNALLLYKSFQIKQ